MEHRDDYQNEAAALTAIAGKLGCSPDSLRTWVRQVQRDGGERPGPTSEEKARIKELERENRELRQANEILRKGETIFRHWSEDNGRTRILHRQSSTARFANDFFHSLPGSRYAVSTRGEESREFLGVEPICRALQFAPSTYYERRAIARDPEQASPRAKSDAALSLKIDKAWTDNRKLYGARKIWHVLLREGEDVARCTVERLMRSLGIKGVMRGKKVITTNPDTSLPCPDDKVNRLFKADRPNKVWVSDFTYVPTWSGTVYVAFVIDVFARRIVGWRTSTSMKTQFVLDVRTAVQKFATEVAG